MSADPPLRVARQVDCRGLMCPLPVLETEKALSDIATGDVVRIECTDPASTVDIAALCARSGHELLRTATAPGVWSFWIQKK